jgi:hypothetical protein
MAVSAILGYFAVPMSTGRKRHLALRGDAVTASLSQ